MVLLRCPECGGTFEKEKRKTFLVKGGKFTACSPKCRGKFSRKLVLNTENVTKSLAGNVIKEFMRL